MNKDKALGSVLLILAVLILLNAINEFRSLQEENVLWSTYVMAYGGVLLAILMGASGAGMLRKK